MIKLKSLLSEQEKRWSAVVIDDESRNKLISTYKSIIPSGWEIICHHMTINFKGLSNEEGRQVKLKVIALGKSDKAIAVKVEGFSTTNKIPHITVAINRAGGAKPKDSNDIQSWEPVDGIELNGVVKNL